jgi:hypothetical protein
MFTHVRCQKQAARLPWTRSAFANLQQLLVACSIAADKIVVEHQNITNVAGILVNMVDSAVDTMLMALHHVCPA